MCPLLIDKSGEKFGKTAVGQQMQQFYLSGSRTSSFILYQALLNITDEMARRAIYPLTHMTAYDIDRMLEEQVSKFRLVFLCTSFFRLVLMLRHGHYKKI